MISRDDVVTFEQLDGCGAVRRLGSVSGTASRPRNRLRATFRSLGMLVGLAALEFVGDAEQLRGEALDALRGRAEDLGADAVIGLRFLVSEGDDGSCEVTASGEAVALPAGRA